MTDADTWIAVTREDGETVGYLDPVTEDYGTVQPRNTLGHPVGEGPVDYLDGEELLIERGISELAEQWLLDDGGGELPGALTVVELSTRGIVVADYYESKGLTAEKKVVVSWPDTARRLKLKHPSR